MNARHRSIESMQRDCALAGGILGMSLLIAMLCAFALIAAIVDDSREVALADESTSRAPILEAVVDAAPPRSVLEGWLAADVLNDRIYDGLENGVTLASGPQLDQLQAEYDALAPEFRDRVGAYPHLQEAQATFVVLVEEEAARIATEEAAYYGYADTSYAYYGGSDYGNPFRSAGVTSDDAGRSYTWYSQRVLAGGGLTALNENGRHVDESTGYIVDGDGYIAIAVPKAEEKSETNPDGYAQGDVIDTPWGEAKVYDVNEGDSWDVYTDF